MEFVVPRPNKLKLSRCLGGIKIVQKSVAGGNKVIVGGVLAASPKMEIRLLLIHVSILASVMESQGFDSQTHTHIIHMCSVELKVCSHQPNNKVSHFYR